MGENTDQGGFANVSATKTRNDENFPVASRLIPARLRPHVDCFYLCVRAADDIADHAQMTPEEKMDRLTRFDDVLTEKITDPSAVPEAYAHLQSAGETGVTIDHARHLLQAFMMDVTKSRYRNWSELINYCRYSAAPVGRYLLDLHGEDDSAKPKTDALCIALQILNHLQDCRNDYRELDRVYIPEDFLRAEGTNVEALDSSSASPEMRRVIDRILERTATLVSEAANAPPMIVDRGLRMETSVIVCIARALTRKLGRRDPIGARVELSKMQTLMCALSGVFRRGVLF